MFVNTQFSTNLLTLLYFISHTHTVFFLFNLIYCSEKELRNILSLRCQEEDVDMTAEALELLTRLAKDSASLRYAMHMITAASLTAKQRKAIVVDVPDVSRVYDLFSDLRRSTQFLIDHNKQFMFNELGGGAEGDEEEQEEVEGGSGGGAAVGTGATTSTTTGGGGGGASNAAGGGMEETS